MIFISIAKIQIILHLINQFHNFVRIFMEKYKTLK